MWHNVKFIHGHFFKNYKKFKQNKKIQSDMWQSLYITVNYLKDIKKNDQIE